MKKLILIMMVSMFSMSGFTANDCIHKERTAVSGSRISVKGCSNERTTIRKQRGFDVTAQAEGIDLNVKSSIRGFDVTTSITRNEALKVK